MATAATPTDGKKKRPKARFTYAWGGVTAGVICVVGITWRMLLTHGVSGPPSIPSVAAVFGEAVAILCSILIPSFFIGLVIWRWRGYVAPMIALFWAIGTVEEAREVRRFDLSAAALDRVIGQSSSVQEIEWRIAQDGLQGGAVAVFQALAVRQKELQRELKRRFPILEHPILTGPLPANPSRTFLREASSVARRVIAVIPQAAHFERQAYQTLVARIPGLAQAHGASPAQAQRIAEMSEQALNRQLMEAAQLYEAIAREAESMAVMFDFLVARYGAWRQKADGSFEFRWAHDADRFKGLLASVDAAGREIDERVEALKAVSF